MSSAFEGLPKTPNLKLNKPGYDNVSDIEALNENADILDAEIQDIKNTFVKSVNGINAGDGGNVDLGIMPIAKGGTGQTTASGVRNALGLGNTTGAVPIANGGTGATTAANARTNLGLGNVATLNTVPIANGGTGANNASDARTNLGLGSVATENIVPISKGGTGAISASDACDNLGAERVTDYQSGDYIKYKSGLCVQWGYATANANVTFPVPFKSKYNIVATLICNDAQWGMINIPSRSTTGFSLVCRGGDNGNTKLNYQYYWQAIGDC